MKSSSVGLLDNENLVKVFSAVLLDIALDFIILVVGTVFLGFVLATVFKGPSEMVKDIANAVAVTKPVKIPMSPNQKDRYVARPENEGEAIANRIQSILNEPFIV